MTFQAFSRCLLPMLSTVFSLMPGLCKRRGAALDPPILMQACPEFASWARNMSGYLKDWSDLHLIAGQLRPMIGVFEHSWNVAQDHLGP